MKQIIAVIGGSAIQKMDDGRISFPANASLETADKPNPAGSDKDPSFVTDESMGLDSGSVNYIAISKEVVKFVPQLVLGSAVTVYNHETKMFVSDAVVGSQGSSKRIGQISIALAKALGIPTKPDGIAPHSLDFTITPK